MGRFMRLLVFFDLPVKTREDRRRYAQFHRFLIRDGYAMLQLSVYARVCNGAEAVATHVTRLRAHAPERGAVRYMQVTEKQYAGIQILVGTKTRREQAQTSAQLTFF